MKQNIKRPVYLVTFTFLGILLAILIGSIVELWYTTLLLADFNRYSFGLNWSDLFQIRDFLAVIVILASALWGYRCGVYWWHQIYELKIYAHSQWLKKDYSRKLGLAYVIVLILVAVYIYASSGSRQPDNNLYNPSRMNTMKIQSPAFTQGSNVPEKYTCKGAGVNPELDFGKVPATAKSLALIMDDPDAPNGTFVHWVVYNMPPATKMIAENSKPPGIQAKNGAGTNKYIGPCPPSGTHRYYFKLYALNAMLKANSVQDKAGLVAAMQGHVLMQTQLTAKFTH